MIAMHSLAWAELPPFQLHSDRQVLILSSPSLIQELDNLQDVQVALFVV